MINATDSWSQESSQEAGPGPPPLNTSPSPAKLSSPSQEKGRPASRARDATNTHAAPATPRRSGPKLVPPAVTTKQPVVGPPRGGEEVALVAAGAPTTAGAPVALHGHTEEPASDG